MLGQSEENVYSETLRPSLWRTVRFLVFCVLLIAFGVWVDNGAKNVRNLLGRYLAIGGGVWGLLIFTVRLVPGSTFLLITNKGICVRSIWRTKSYDWSDIIEFGTTDVPELGFGLRWNPHVGINFSEEYQFSHRPHEFLLKWQNTERRLSRVRRFNRILPDTFGRDGGSLANYLEQLRQHFTAEQLIDLRSDFADASE